ncbi:MAG: hypothetical protein M3122_07070 [Actinomycetota bacterium]|nr:hypothetical protein [Actinomycetota bacterium]
MGPIRPHGYPAPDISSRAPGPFPYTVRTDNAPKVRFSATLGEEPENELVLI